MRAVLQIFCTISVIVQIGKSCLSNPNLRCSPSHYSSQSPSYDSSCQTSAQSAPSPSIYQSGQYNGFLGSYVQPRAYSGKGNKNEFATQDLDLRCHDDESCRWRNDANDELDWVIGSGEVDLAKLALITGSNTSPEKWFLILASDPRPNFQGGSLVSPPIGCQQSTGLLFFRMWKSRSRDQMSEPDIDICTRRLPEETLENCLTVNITDNHTIIASIPPIFEPFEIVLRGYDFSNTPEGGLLILDSIDYFAHVDTPENCIGRQLDSESESGIEALNQTGTLEDSELLFTKILNTSSFTLKSLTDDESTDWCSQIQCGLNKTPPCGYSVIGQGALGFGLDKGWRITSIPNNIANRLTGIHVPPGPKESIEQGKGEGNQFFVAEFPGFNRTRIEHRFILESPNIELEADVRAWLGFQKYLSTQGVEIAICEGINMTVCFWDNFLQSAEPFTRQWTNEIVELPPNINKFFIVASQDPSIAANNGQVGIADLSLYADPEGKEKLC